MNNAAKLNNNGFEPKLDTSELNAKSRHFLLRHYRPQPYRNRSTLNPQSQRYKRCKNFIFSLETAKYSVILLKSKDQSWFLGVYGFSSASVGPRTTKSRMLLFSFALKGVEMDGPPVEQCKSTTLCSLWDLRFVGDSVIRLPAPLVSIIIPIACLRKG